MLILDGYNVLLQYFRGQEIVSLPLRREQFLRVLQAYCVAKGKNALVYFDAETSGEPFPIRKQILRGRLSVIFTARGTTADDAIIAHLEESRDRSTLTVITSDRVILKEAERLRVKTQTSDKFCDEMERSLDRELSAYDVQKAEGISSEEADAWGRAMGLRDDELERDVSEG